LKKMHCSGNENFAPHSVSKLTWLIEVMSADLFGASKSLRTLRLLGSWDDIPGAAH
jgi:hypothetical protein